MRKQPDAVRLSALGGLSLALSPCSVTSWEKQHKGPQPLKFPGWERKERAEEEEKEEQNGEEGEEGESGSTAILHASAALETPSSDKMGRPVWLPSSVARRRTRTTAAAAAAARRTPCLNKS